MLWLVYLNDVEKYTFKFANELQNEAVSIHIQGVTFFIENLPLFIGRFRTLCNGKHRAIFSNYEKF